MVITDLKCISSDECINDQDGKENQSFAEPDERLFAVEDALLLNKTPLGYSSSFFARHR